MGGIEPPAFPLRRDRSTPELHWHIVVFYHAENLLTLYNSFGIMGCNLRSRGVAVNMRPCQGRDRRFESGRDRNVDSAY